MGLPQSAEPFDRATLLMFLDPCLKEKFIRQQNSVQISKEAYAAQLERLDKLRALFEQELKKEKITLTPRDLFFKIFGGEEEFWSTNKRFNDEEIQISPIEIFEFHLSDKGKGHWYTSDEEEKRRIGENMRALYACPNT